MVTYKILLDLMNSDPLSFLYCTSNYIVPNLYLDFQYFTQVSFEGDIILNTETLVYQYMLKGEQDNIGNSLQPTC